jgi:hypothetical protein
MKGSLNRSKIEYVLFHLRLQFELDDSLIDRFRFVEADSIGGHEEGCILFPLSRNELDDLPMVRVDDVPVLFSLSGRTDIFRWENGSVVFTHDFLKSAFYLLSGYQETASSRRDHFGRFPYSGSIHERLGIVGTPVVNYYFRFIGEGIRAFCDATGHFFGRKKVFDTMGFMLTHDVDFIDTYTLRGTLFRIKRLLVRKVSRNSFKSDVVFFIHYLVQYLHFFRRSNPHWDFDYLLEQAGKRGFTPVFYFLHKDLKRQDSTYRFDDKRIKGLFRLLKEHGCEIGLHGSTRSATDPTVMKDHRERLIVHSESVVTGIRQHRLIHNNIMTTRIQEQAGFTYDATMGFAEHEGFRHSFCLPFRLYDFEKEEMTTIWHIPLVVMDATLYIYRGLHPDHAFASVLDLVEECKKFNGIFTLLWHNGNFDEEDYPTGKQLFERILDEIQKQNAESLKGQECIDQLENVIGDAHTDGA